MFPQDFPTNFPDTNLPYESDQSNFSDSSSGPGSRYLESQRRDALFVDPLAAKLAGPEGLAQPMGDWIMVPRTRCPRLYDVTL